MATQSSRQITVQLNHVQVAQALNQGLCERGQAWADLDHGLACQGVDGVNDAIDDGAIGQKVLTKALAGNVFQNRPSLLRWIAVFHISASAHLLDPQLVGLFEFFIAQVVANDVANFALAQCRIATREDLNQVNTKS